MHLFWALLFICDKDLNSLWVTIEPSGFVIKRIIKFVTHYNSLWKMPLSKTKVFWKKQLIQMFLLLVPGCLPSRPREFLLQPSHSNSLLETQLHLNSQCRNTMELRRCCCQHCTAEAVEKSVMMVDMAVTMWGIAGRAPNLVHPSPSGGHNTNFQRLLAKVGMAKYLCNYLIFCGYNHFAQTWG